MVLILSSAPPAGAQDILSLFESGEEGFAGMGGNPFSASAGDASLFASGIKSGKPFATIQYRTDDIYHETRLDGTETLLQGDLKRFELSVPLSDTSLSAKVGLNVISAGSDAVIDQSPSERAGYSSEYNVASISYEMSPFPSMHVRAAYGRRYDAARFPGSYEGTLSFLVPGGITLSAKLGSWRYSESLRLDITDVQGVLPLDYVRRGWEISARIPVEDFQINCSVQQSVFSSGANPSCDFDTRFVPDGTGLGFHLQGVASLGDKRKVLLSLNSERNNGSGSFYSSGQEYGSIDRLELSDFSLMAGFEQVFNSGGLLEGDLRWRRISGSLEGEAENWPFVSIMVSLFPVRENVKLNAALSFYQLHAGGVIPILKFFRLSLGTSLVRLLPDCTLDSWESKYLVFGVRGYKERNLTTRIIDAAILSVGGQVRLLSFEVNYSLTQFLPIRSVRSEGSGDKLTPTTTSPVVHASGGCVQSLTLSYEF